MHAPEVSVIIPCRNAASVLPVQLASLDRQEWDGCWEIVLVVHDSSDDTLAVAYEATSRLAVPCRVVRPSEGGMSAGAARNAGVMEAEGRHLIFVDADDEVAAGWLQAMAAALREHELVTGRLELERLNPKAAVAAKSPTAGPQDWGASHPVLPYATTANLGVWREFHEKVSGFDPTLVQLEDIDYCWKLQEVGLRIHRESAALVHYRLPHTLAAQCRKAWREGQVEPLLYRRHGAPVPREFAQIRVLAWFLAGWLLVRRDGVRRVVVNYAWNAGRVVGCFRYRYLRWLP